MKKIMLLSVIALGGCSTYSETFDCSPGQGVGCKSLSQVNKMVEKGQLPYAEEESSNLSIPDRPIPKRDTPLQLTADVVPTKRIWFASRKDVNGYVSAGHYQNMEG